MSRPAALDDIFPRPVMVELAGAMYKTGPLTLGDLATLQSWLRQAAPHPLDGLPAPHDDPDPGSRRARLLTAWAAAKSWPPALGTDEDADLLESPEGRAVFVLVCLGRWDDGFTAERARDLAGRMGPDDWARLRRVAWSIPPWRELAAELDPAWLADQLGPREETDWGRLVAVVIGKAGLDFAAIERWTPTQLRVFCSEGALGEYRAVRLPGETDEQMGERVRGCFTIPGPSPAE